MYEKVLVIKLSSLGDIIHVFPAVKALKKRLPEVRVSCAVNREFAPILECFDDVNEVFIFERSQWGALHRLPVSLQEMRTFASVMQSRKFDVAFDFMGLLRSGLLGYFSGAKQRVGFADSREMSPLFYTRKVDARQKHAVDRNLELVSETLGIDSPQVDFGVSAPEYSREKIRRILKDLPRPIVAISPTARWVSKQWGDERFAELSRKLTKELSASVVFFGAPSEVPQINSVLERADVPALNLAGQTSLPDLVALLEEADLLISNDSGPMHIRAALSKPLLAIFGPTDPARVGPYGMSEDVISAQTNCAPCRRKDCADPVCIRQIPVQTVFDRAKSKL